MTRSLHIGGHQHLPVEQWQVAATPPGAWETPAAARLGGSAGAGWITARSPTTAADALRAAGAFHLDGPVRRFDAEDWWFRARLPEPAAEGDDELVLRLDGLATVADVWVDDDHRLTSENMFRSHQLPLGRGGGEIHIRCRALEPLLGARRPRPRWRAPMIEHQQLRWFRTTLLGRTPGWSPPVPAVGPWRPVVLERRVGVAVDELALQVRIEDGAGVVELHGRLRWLGARAASPVTLVVERGGRRHQARVRVDGEQIAARLEVAEPERWWPHTHGEPALYQAWLEIERPAITVALAPIGFREVVRDGDFSLRVNGAPVFLRGACWTPLDPLTLRADRPALATALGQVRAAGMNLVRVGGTMVYESDDFLDLCDELGVMVWQDFMFANMDYPEEPSFAQEVAAEARQQLGRLQARPCLAVLCGNSEVEQQAAMWGAPRERWTPPLFHQELPALARELCPDVPYWPSSAHGGAFPHQADVGTSSYYGVGAYLLPLDDARRAGVRFASECLAFANVPEPSGLPGGPSLRVHHPRWKERTPRDLGAGWDFDDVRDHYLGLLFRVDPAALRYADHERYLALGRVATGEVMAQAFGEWRRARSTCRGALVWFLRDLWPGAGWGVVDAHGAPKAAWYYLRRALAPIAAHLSDERGNGVALHLGNDGPAAVDGEIEVALYRGGEVAVGSARRPIALPPRQAVEVPVASLFDGFLDLAYSYRFGPPAHDLMVATLRSPAGLVLAEAHHFPVGLPSTQERDLGLSAELEQDADGARLRLRTRRFAQSIAIDVEGFTPADAYFHLAPGGERVVALVPTRPGRARGSVQALNAEAPTRIVSP